MNETFNAGSLHAIPEIERRTSFAQCMTKNGRPIIFSPAKIKFLLHCYLEQGIHRSLEDPEVNLGDHETLQFFIQLQAIEKIGDRIYRTTPLGAAWVHALCNVTIPEQVFIDEQGSVLK